MQRSATDEPRPTTDPRPLAAAWTGLRGLPAMLFLGAFLLVTVLSGWVTLEEGTSRFLWPFTQEDPVGFVKTTAASVRADPSDENIRAVSVELWGLAQLTSVEHIADSKLPEQGILYAGMPRLNQVLMLSHVLLAAFCMLFGGLQFWSWFRKRYMRAHRTIGAIYIATVPPAVLTALAYLTVTAPHHIYDHLVAWIALWIFGALALVAVTMAVLAIRARRIHEHQAWMAISFGCLLVAPLLRWDWVWLAWLFPGIDQETLNLVTMGVMLPETLLIAYFLILINRQFERPMTRRALPTLSGIFAQGYQRALPVFYFVAAVVAAALVNYLLINQGMAGHDWFAGLAHTALIAREHQVLLDQQIVTWALALGLMLAMPVALHVLGQLLRAKQIADVSAQTRKLSVVTSVAALVAGLAAISIGWRIGLEENRQLFSGGTFYTVNGVVIVGFALFHLLANRRGQLALMKESLVFLMTLLPFPALFFASSWALHYIGLPSDYLTAGQGFVLPAGFSAGLFFIAMLHVVYNQATREHN